MKCEKCGKDLLDNEVFCPECGHVVVDADQKNQESEKKEKKSKKSEKVKVVEAVKEAEGVKEETVVEKKVPTPEPFVQTKEAPVLPQKVGFGRYFIILLLNLIPVVGFFFILIFALAGKNKNFKNFCRAVLVVDLIIFITLAIVAAFVGGAIYNEYFDLYVLEIKIT